MWKTSPAVSATRTNRPNYTADAWRGRVYAVRYFLSFAVSGAAVSLIALLHGRGGFALVLATTAIIAFALMTVTIAIGVLVNGAERRSQAVQTQPAE
jgi:hypothetical protein